MAESHGARAPSETPWNARAIARRNRAANDRPLSPVMKTAATARELAHAGDTEADER
jgi:hypothetical protein